MLVLLDTKGTLTYEKKGKISNSEKVIATLIFELNDVINLPGFKTITLSTFDFNYSSVKLKNTAMSFYAVIEVDIAYYNLENEKRNLSLQPIKISNLVPRNKTSNNEEQISAIQDKKINVQIIPPNNFVESIKIKITEVNNRKKDWDNWLKLYNDNSDKLKDYLLEITN